MTYPDYIREKARRLRVEQQLSVDEIAERLAVAKSTAFYWVSDLPLERPARWTPGRERAAQANSDRYRLVREAAYARGAEEFAQLAARPTFREFVALYVAEGYKRNRNVVSISNSDPTVLMLSARWLRELTDRALVFSIQFHADQDLEELRRFWSGCLACDPVNIRFQRKSNSGQLNGRNWRSEHGVLTIWVYDTELRCRLQAWIDLVKTAWQ